MSNFGDRQTLKLIGLNRRHSRANLMQGEMKTPFPCVIGKNGQSARKREGDASTPRGYWRPLMVLYRADRINRPLCQLPISPIERSDGWCDDPKDRNYNRPINHPYPASAEHLWREDELYDLLVVLDHNQRPRIKGCGSAIFMHVAKNGYPPTEGCIALQKKHLKQLLPRLTDNTRIII